MKIYNLTKVCTKCGIEKPLSEFYKDKYQKSGYTSHCKACHTQYAIENRERRNLYAKEWQKNNKEKTSKARKKHYKKNKKQLNKNSAIYYRLKRANNKEFKILTNLRRRVNLALVGKSKANSTKQMLGCSVDFFKKYIESKFQPGMSWENYGLHGWHIDHIIPCVNFDLSKKSEQLKCFHYTNLQPLWALDNLKKGSK